MTSPVSAIEAIEKAMQSATQGEWVIHGGMLGHNGDIFSPTAKRVPDCHHIARFFAPKPANPALCELQAIQIMRDAVAISEANAAYVAACSPDRMREVLALARQAEALQRRAEEAEALAERLKLEAQSHAQEARTANSTIYEIYQAVSGGKGEPGNWHGAKPVRAKLEALQRSLRELTDAGTNLLNGLDARIQSAPRNAVPVFYGIVDLSDALNSARALLGGENAE